MEDIMQKLQGILSTKDGQDQLKNIASMFSQNNNEPEPPVNNAKVENNINAENQDNPLGSFDLNSLLKLQQVFSTMNVKDKNTELLLALKPHFSAERAGKVDKAISMMRLFSMAPTILPMLKDSGILQGILPF